MSKSLSAHWAVQLFSILQWGSTSSVRVCPPSLEVSGRMGVVFPPPRSSLENRQGSGSFNASASLTAGLGSWSKWLLDGWLTFLSGRVRNRLMPMLLLERRDVLLQAKSALCCPEVVQAAVSCSAFANILKDAISLPKYNYHPPRKKPIRGRRTQTAFAEITHWSL